MDLNVQDVFNVYLNFVLSIYNVIVVFLTYKSFMSFIIAENWHAAYSVILFLFSSEINVKSVQGTLVVFLQNDAGYTKWEPTTERLRELLLAYRLSEPPRN